MATKRLLAIGFSHVITKLQNVFSIRGLEIRDLVELIYERV